MYKKDELVGLEKNFAARHFPAVVLLIIYLVVETFQSFSVGAPAFIRAAMGKRFNGSYINIACDIFSFILFRKNERAAEFLSNH